MAVSSFNNIPAKIHLIFEECSHNLSSFKTKQQKTEFKKGFHKYFLNKFNPFESIYLGSNSRLHAFIPLFCRLSNLEEQLWQRSLFCKFISAIRHERIFKIHICNHRWTLHHLHISWGVIVFYRYGTYQFQQ